MAHDCVLLIGHGSRESAANEEFESVARAYRKLRPERRVETAYIELVRPLVREALGELARDHARIVLVPLFLFAGGHVKNDLPLAIAEIRRSHPHCRITAAPALGVHPSLINLALRRAFAAGSSDPSRRAKTLLLVVGRGASDPDANGDFCKTARLLGESGGFLHAEPTFIGITAPRVEESLERVARLRPERLVVLPYFLFAGRLLVKLRDQVQAFSARHPWIPVEIADHLGNDERILSLIDERANQALSGEAELACDNCVYRADVGTLPSQIGGLRALLYSARHTLTHSQAALPLHVHKPLRKHVFVCANADCVERGSIAVLESMRREVKNAGRGRDVKVTRTACMGRCGEGPTVAIYPDGVWYRRVAPQDAAEIVREHVVGDRLVSRLVDDILQ